MDILHGKAAKLAVKLVKKGGAAQIVELVSDDLITVDIQTDIPCNLVRQFKDHRLYVRNEDDDLDEEDEVEDKIEPYTSKPLLCSCVLSKQKELQDKIHMKSKLKRDIYIYHNGTLLELAAAHGQPGVVNVLLDQGADPHAMYDGTTALLQALLHWGHTHNLQARGDCVRYRKVVILLLQKINVEKYCRLWEECPITDKHHKMKFHPVNYACSLDFSVGLEMLLKTGFKVPDGRKIGFVKSLVSVFLIHHQQIQSICWHVQRNVQTFIYASNFGVH